MHIAILTGGISTERAVALRSGKNMEHWVGLAGHTCDVFDFPAQIDDFLVEYRSFDIVIPMFHGVYGEDGQVTAFLKTLGCHVAYSPFTTHALCLDKYRTNLFVEKMGIKIPETIFIEKHAKYPEIDLTFPLIVKPNRGGSSIATSKVDSQSQLIEAYELITDDDILVQRCIEGREFTVGVYKDDTGYHALPIMEIVTHDNKLFDYSEKYETDGYNEIFAEIDETLASTLNTESEAIARMLHCKGAVRIDYRYDGTDIYFLEVNTIPGFTAASFVPKMWKKAGKTEKEFIEMLAN